MLNYLFGKDRSKTITKETFFKLHKELLDELMELEFNEYDMNETGRMSEIDFCKFLMRSAKIPPKKNAAMMKRIQERWPKKGEGVSLKSFKNVYHVLVGGADLERALFFLDAEVKF